MLVSFSAYFCKLCFLSLLKSNSLTGVLLIGIFNAADTSCTSLSESVNTHLIIIIQIQRANPVIFTSVLAKKKAHSPKAWNSFFLSVKTTRRQSIEFIIIRAIPTRRSLQKKTLAVIECNSSQHTSYLTVGSTIFTTSSNSCKVGRSCPSVQTINAVFQSYRRPHLTQGSSLFPRTRFHRQLEWYPQTRSL